MTERDILIECIVRTLTGAPLPVLREIYLIILTLTK